MAAAATVQRHHKKITTEKGSDFVRERCSGKNFFLMCFMAVDFGVLVSTLPPTEFVVLR